MKPIQVSTFQLTLAGLPEESRSERFQVIHATIRKILAMFAVGQVSRISTELITLAFQITGQRY